MAAWDVLTCCQTQLRISPAGGVIGLDMGVALQVADALGYGRAEVARLLPYAEAGLLAALRAEGVQGAGDG